MNKEERIIRFKSMSSMQREELILKKMKERGIEFGSRIPNKNMIVEMLVNKFILLDASQN